MRLLGPDREADVYAISCRLGLTKIGVAVDARERCRAMQVGSPVELELAGSYRFRSAQDAYAVAAAVKRQLAERHERGGWYRVRPEQVRQVLGNRCARQAPRAAAAARQVVASAQAEAERVRAQRARERGRSRAQARRQKVRALASLLASGLTRREAAEVSGVDERTIRRWAKLPGFADELAKAHIREQSRRERARERQHKRREAEERRRLARLGPQQNAGSGVAERSEPERPAADSSAAAPPDRRVRIVDESGPARPALLLRDASPRTPRPSDVRSPAALAPFYPRLLPDGALLPEFRVARPFPDVWRALLVAADMSLEMSHRT